MARLDGKVAIVTGGGGSGIGHGISLELARAGACTAIFEVDLAAGEQVRDEIQRCGGEALVVRADISRASEVRAAVEEVIRQFERIDILVNSAGVGLIRPVAEASEEEFDRLAAVDLRGAWLCAKYVIPCMQRQRDGVIVNIASVHSRATMPQYGLYAAVKAGLVGLTRGIAVQYGADGIRANVISPGLVDGKQTRETVAQFTADVEGWMREFLRRNQASPRPIQPEDVGRVVTFLASDEARAITGAEIPVDGGMWALLVGRE